ncbi:MAG: YbhN family protein [Bacteroidota bacterium]
MRRPHQRLFTVKQLRTILQYLLVLGITAALLWFALKSIDSGDGRSPAEFLGTTWAKANKGYLFIMFLVTMVSHVVRAIRWQMLLVPAGHRSSFTGAFLALMTGYLVNLVVPRGGEITRSINLYKLEKVPVDISFGTVVVERVVDVICLLALVLLSFWIEWDKLEAFMQGLPIGTGGELPGWLIPAAIGLVLLIPLVLLLRKNKKVLSFLEGFRSGLLSVFKLEKKGLFLFYSVTIWALYFVTSYWVIMAFEQTAALGVSAVFTIFAIGSIAMAMPLPGGTGSYHTLVPMGLVTLYHLPKPDAVALVIIFHAVQTIILIVCGVIAALISWWLIRKRSEAMTN